MDKSDIWGFVWIFFLYIYMIGIRIILPQKQTQDIAGFAGIFILIGGLVLQDYYFMMKTAPFNYLKLILRPSGKTLHLFIKKVETKKIEENPLYSTTLDLSFIVNHPTFGKVKQLVLQHEYPIGKRLIFDHGQASYLGYAVNHPNTCIATAYEYPSGAYDVDHANPIPVFRLKDAPGDYWLAPINPASNNPSGAPYQNVANLRKRLDKMAFDLAEKRREAHDWHQKAITTEEVNTHLKNELVGILNSKSDFRKAVVEYFLTWREAQVTIEQAVKSMKGIGTWFQRWMLYPIMLVIVVSAVTLNPQWLGGFREWMAIGSNQVLFLIVAIIVATTFYYTIKKRGK